MKVQTVGAMMPADVTAKAAAVTAPNRRYTAAVSAAIS